LMYIIDNQYINNVFVQCASRVFFRIIFSIFSFILNFTKTWVYILKVGNNS